MHTWQWQSWNGLPYLTCPLLADFPHGFFTQQAALHSPEDLTAALSTQATPYRVKQVHGNRVLSSSEIAARITAAPSNTAITQAGLLPEADGVVTDGANHAAWVCTADCVPVLIADGRTGRVASAHAGWRGTASAIVPRAIARLQAQGSALADLRVVLGPAIAGEVYQVSTAVAATVGASIVPEAAPQAARVQVEASAETTPLEPVSIERSGAAIELILNRLRQLPNSPLLPDPQFQRVRLDVRRVIALQLEHVGLDIEQVAIAPFCTYQMPEYFYSYRRNPQKKVQWSGIVSR